MLGSFPSAYIFARLGGVEDIREAGSGTMGTYNVLRVVGKKAASLTLISDVLKGTLAVSISWAAANYSELNNLALVAGYGAVLGHIFPLYVKFQGGKGLAVYGGSLLLISQPVLGLVLVSWLAAYKLTGKMVLSSVLAFTVIPPTFLLITAGMQPLLWYTLAAGSTIGLRHWPDLNRELRQA